MDAENLRRVLAESAAESAALAIVAESAPEVTQPSPATLSVPTFEGGLLAGTSSTDLTPVISPLVPGDADIVAGSGSADLGGAGGDSRRPSSSSEEEIEDRVLLVGSPDKVT